MTSADDGGGGGPWHRPVLAGAVANLAAGTLFGWSLVAQPAADALGTSRSSASAVFATAIVVFAVVLLVLAPVQRRSGPRRLLHVAAAAGGGGLLLAATAQHPVVLLLGVGILFGGANGLAYGVAVWLAAQVPGSRRGSATGLVVGAYAAGPVLLGLVAPPALDAFGWRPCVAVVAMAVAVLLTVAAALTPGGRPGKGRPSRPHPVPHRDVVLLWIVFAGGTAPGLMLFAHAVTVADDRGLSARAAGLAVSALAAGNLLGRLTAGVWSDRIGRLPALGLALTTGAMQVAMDALAATAIPAHVRDANGLIYVIPASTGNFGNALIYLDGRHVDTVKADSHALIVAVPGRHEISTAGRTRAVFSLEAEAGRSYYLRLTIKADGFPEFALLSDAEGQQAVAQTQVSREPRHANTVAPPAAATTAAASSRSRTPTAERSRESSGAYIGIGPGVAAAVGLEEELTVAAEWLQGLTGADTVAEADNSGVGAKFFVGYAFNEVFALEAFYANLGEYKITAVADDGFDQATAIDKWTVRGFGIAATGALPLNNWFALFGKLGFVSWNSEYESTISDTTGFSATLLTEDKSGTSPLFGVGAQFNISNRWALRTEYERYMDIGEQDTFGHFDVDLMSVSAMFRF